MPASTKSLPVLHMPLPPPINPFTVFYHITLCINCDRLIGNRAAFANDNGIYHVTHGNNFSNKNPSCTMHAGASMAYFNQASAIVVRNDYIVTNVRSDGLSERGCEGRLDNFPSSTAPGNTNHNIHSSLNYKHGNRLLQREYYTPSTILSTSPISRSPSPSAP